MTNELQELRNTARFNKQNLMNTSIISNIDGSDYALIIKGVGAKAVKFELYISYEDLLKFHHHKHLENVLYDKINTVYPTKKRGNIWRVNG